MSSADSPGRWLAIVGLGEDGVEGLSPSARALVAGAELVVGGERHLALVQPLAPRATLAWGSPLSATIPQILALRGRPVCVLASGDPWCFGVGATLARHLPVAEMQTLPAPSAFSLAAARLGWPLAEVACLSLCGRPLEPLRPQLQPGRRILLLSADAATPAIVAAQLVAWGFGPSRLHLLEALGGPRERVTSWPAERFAPPTVEALNLLALEVAAAPGACVLPRAAGLPDDWFEHDGQLTKREVRAVTLAALAPTAGELLWDIGCGAGSVAIEWLLAHPANRALGVEDRPERAGRAARNAAALGVPHLELVTGRAPAALAGLPTPDAIFIGGGAGEPGLLGAAWTALRPGGRLVANGVTLETAALLAEAYRRHGGELIRLAVERAGTVGRLHGLRPAMAVTQWSCVKP